MEGADLLEEGFVDLEALLVGAFLGTALGLWDFLRIPRSRSYWTLMWRAAKQREVSNCS